jgi:hypothetical protein
MPIARSENRNTCGNGICDPSIKDGNNLVALADGKSPSGAEVVLDVNDDERIAGVHHVSIVKEEKKRPLITRITPI